MAVDRRPVGARLPCMSLSSIRLKFGLIEWRAWKGNILGRQKRLNHRFHASCGEKLAASVFSPLLREQKYHANTIALLPHFRQTGAREGQRRPAALSRR